MSFVTVLLLVMLCALVATGLVAAAFDLSKLGAHALDMRRIRRACRHGWDWPAFEREVARYAGRRGGHKPTAPPSR